MIKVGPNVIVVILFVVVMAIAIAVETVVSKSFPWPLACLGGFVAFLLFIASVIGNRCWNNLKKERYNTSGS
jgi:membrane protein implicated in regulation of membrane protease activity